MEKKKPPVSFTRLPLFNQFHLQPVALRANPSPSPPPPPPLAVPSSALCGSQLRGAFNPAFEHGAETEAQERRGEEEEEGRGGGRPFCLSSRRSGVPPLRSALTHPLQSCSFLLFSSPFSFFSSSCLDSLLLFFSFSSPFFLSFLLFLFSGTRCRARSHPPPQPHPPALADKSNTLPL